MCTLLHPFLCNTLLAAGAAAWPHSAAGEGLVSPEIAQGNFGCTLYQPKQVSRLRDRTRNNIMAIYEMMGGVANSERLQIHTFSPELYLSSKYIVEADSNQKPLRKVRPSGPPRLSGT